MNLAQAIRPLFPTVIVGVEVDSKLCSLTARYYKSGRLTKTIHHEFKTIPGELPMKAVRFIRKIRTKNPYVYVSTLPFSIIQGAINENHENECQKYGIEQRDVMMKTLNNQWMAYVAKEGIAQTKRKFLKVGADFVISPFVILHHLAKDLFQDVCKLYILFQKSNITMIVTKLNEGVLFGSYYILESDIDSELNVVNPHLSEDLEGIDDLSVAGNLQDELTQIDTIDEQSEASDSELIASLKEKNQTKEQEEESSDEKIDSFDDFSRVNSASKFIQLALSEFYTNAIYQSEFINEVVIFNAHGIEEETLRHIQNVTMLDIEIMPCNISDILALLGYESYEHYAQKGEV